jgi:addiction module HigA family antidote
MAEKIMPPIHPGELLREEFLEPMGITAYQLAKDIGVPAPRIYDIVAEKRGISADTALRLSRYFGLNENYWIRLQARYDLETTKDKAGEIIEREVQPREIGTRIFHPNEICLASGWYRMVDQPLPGGQWTRGELKYVEEGDSFPSVPGAGPAQGYVMSGHLTDWN